jgi:hypothetical protein
MVHPELATQMGHTVTAAELTAWKQEKKLIQVLPDNIRVEFLKEFWDINPECRKELNLVGTEYGDN